MNIQRYSTSSKVALVGCDSEHAEYKIYLAPPALPTRSTVLSSFHRHICIWSALRWHYLAVRSFPNESRVLLTAALYQLHPDSASLPWTVALEKSNILPSELSNLSQNDINQNALGSPLHDFRPCGIDCGTKHHKHSKRCFRDRLN